MAQLTAPLSLGELIDRLTILEIKAQRIAAPAKHAHIVRERDALRAAAAPFLAKSAAARLLMKQLIRVNRVLWVTEEASRKRFRRPPNPTAAAPILTRIARYNDTRHRIKQRISRLAKGGIVEQKSYY